MSVNSSSRESVARAQKLRAAMVRHVVVGDGAMGTTLQSYDLSLDDFEGHEGCNEILNLTRPDVVRSVHQDFLAVGVDAIQSNTFGANLGNLGDYGIGHRIHEIAQAGARLAREVADDFTTADRPRWVFGSVGPGTKLPTFGHAAYADLRDAYQTQVAGMIAGGVDAVQIETVQDLLQAKAAIVGAHRAMHAAGVDLPIFVQVTVETTGTMLVGSEIGAALTMLEPLGIDAVGLNCATGPAEMGEHLRYLARHAEVALMCTPNAGLPSLRDGGSYYPLTPVELADAHDTFTREYGVNFVGGCCGTTPDHLRLVVDRVRGREVAPRRPRREPAAASLYAAMPFRQDTAYLSIGERTNANGSKAFREALVAEDWDDCVRIGKDQIHSGAHLLDVCVDYVGRNGVADVEAVVSRLATASTIPLVIDSTEPEIVEAALELIGGRPVVNSVNYEDGDGEGSRIARMMPIVKEHGAAVVALTIDEEGQARTAEWKVRVADRLIRDLVDNWGMSIDDILVDALTFPIATGQEETRRDGLETIEAIRELKRRYPDVNTTLGVSNVSFGLNPPARVVLNSVFLHECVQAGLDSAIVHASKILPMARIPDEQRQAALDLVYDRRRYDDSGALVHDPLAHYLNVFEGVDAHEQARTRADEMAALPLFERLQRRIVDGERNGLEPDLDEALTTRSALEIVNNTLLEGMKTVGELFGRGEMQLPFVLTSAEVMKVAVAYLEPHMERTGDIGKGTIVLATVKGDVHDIGKNLVDIILTNNGYTVVNLGIKVPVSEILTAADREAADVIGMSGLLVKSTLVMKENLQEINLRGVAAQYPVLLGGAALTRSFVEEDLAEVYDGTVRYARDAFEGLRLMDSLIGVKRGVPGASLPELRKRRVARKSAPDPGSEVVDTVRSAVALDNAIPAPPFWGTRVVKGLALAEYAAYLDERATFLGQWGLKPSRADDGPSYEELVEAEGRPRLRRWLDRAHTEGIFEAAVVYGYFPCWSEGNDLVVVHHDGPLAGTERARFSFPRQRRDRRLCLADFFRPRESLDVKSGEFDVIALDVVTMGNHVSEVTAKLFAENAYRDYLELHGLSVQLTEALAEMWHARIRSELGFGSADDEDMETLIAKQGYRGSRYSFGYPACPDVEMQSELVNLLDPGRIGVELSEEFQLHPEQSTSALVVHHPEAKYFNAT
jgi:5-methyltetrahydrofolate--homocysteine methyltransferase